MNSNDILALNINSNTFEAMKKDFDKVLKRTLANMNQKESDEASITLKMSISLTEVEVPDFDSPSPDAVRRIHKPKFDHKISSVMQIKTNESGSLKGEYELVYDAETNEFVMKPIDNGQASFFDGGYADCTESDDCNEDYGPRALPAADELQEDDVESSYTYDE